MKSKPMRKIIPGAMAFMIIASACIHVMAAPVPTDTPKLSVKKVLTLPMEGVKTPDTTFNFTVTKDSFNGKVDQKDKLPELSAASVNYTSADNTDNDNTKDGKQLIKESNDFLNNVQFTEAGQYTYLITETASAKPDDGGQFIDSKAEYKVSLFVAKQEDGTFKVTDIMIAQTKNDAGIAITDPKKTPYNPGADNQFKFENSYDKKAGNSNPTGPTVTEDDKKGFVISKTVSGDNTSTTQEFRFTLKIEKDKGSKSTDTQYNVKIVRANGTIANEKQTYGQAVNFYLKANERAVVSDVLLGAKATVDETDTAGYTPSVTVRANGKDSTDLTVLKDTGFVLGDSDGGNSAAFVNTQQTATGILLDNFPIILLAFVAGLGIFFFVKNRRSESEA